MLKWYQITGPSSDALDNIARDIRNGKMLVRRRNSNLFACVSTHHQNWLSKICADFNSTLKALDIAPIGFRQPSKEVYLAPCGKEVYDPMMYAQHIRNCKECKEILDGKTILAHKAATKAVPRAVIPGAVVPKAAPRAVVPKAKIEPGMDFDLNGVIASVELTRDRLYEQVEIVDDLLKNLKAYRDAKETISKLSTEAKERREAVRLLLAGGRF